MVGKLIFALSLLLMMGSLGLSLREILISVEALKVELGDMEEKAVKQRRKRGGPTSK